MSGVPRVPEFLPGRPLLQPCPPEIVASGPPLFSSKPFLTRHVGAIPNQECRTACYFGQGPHHLLLPRRSIRNLNVRETLRDVGVVNGVAAPDPAGMFDAPAVNTVIPTKLVLRVSGGAGICRPSRRTAEGETYRRANLPQSLVV